MNAIVQSHKVVSARRVPTSPNKRLLIANKKTPSKSVVLGKSAVVRENSAEYCSSVRANQTGADKNVFVFSQPDETVRRRNAPPPIAHLSAQKKLIPFGWYGGKFSHLDWLLPLLPDCHHYCEPFAGSGAILLNRAPSPVETYNDLDGEVVNFFRVLRNEKKQLVEAIGLTPFAREEFAIACVVNPSLSPLERARRFYVRARQVRTGLAQTASIGRWTNCKNTSRAGMSGVISRWLGAIEDLPAVAERLLRVQIENRPAVDAIRLYDSPDTLFYCDPPYVHSTRGDSKAYEFEMTDKQHEELAEVLNNVQGMVAFSNYQAEILDKFFQTPKWHKTVTRERTVHSTKDKRVEILWTNYDPRHIKRKPF